MLPQRWPSGTQSSDAVLKGKRREGKYLRCYEQDGIDDGYNQDDDRDKDGNDDLYNDHNDEEHDDDNNDNDNKEILRECSERIALILQQPAELTYKDRGNDGLHSSGTLILASPLSHLWCQKNPLQTVLLPFQIMGGHLNFIQHVS